MSLLSRALVDLNLLYRCQSDVGSSLAQMVAVISVVLKMPAAGEGGEGAGSGGDSYSGGVKGGD